MLYDKLLDIDLDFLNDSSSPIKKLQSILNKLPRYLPSAIFIEHQHILPQIDRWCKNGVLHPPFDIIHVDEHHDFYHPPFWAEENKKRPAKPNNIHCGNFYYYLPKEYYRGFTWVKNSMSADCFQDFPFAMKWLKSQHKKCSTTNSLPSLANVMAVVFCVSPDYIDGNAMKFVNKLVKKVTDHFCLDVTVKLNGNSITSPSAWKRMVV